jgi:hypothetical protein
LEAWKAGKFGWAVRGEVGSRAGPFIGAGRSVWARIFLSSRSFDGRQWRWKYLGVDFGQRASVRRGAVRCDASCRRLLRKRRGDRSGGSNGGLV